MLVLLSFALVLVATVLLVLGLLNDDNGMTLIYLSIASSVAAAIVLLVALKVSKPRQEVQRAAPEPLPEPEPEPALATVGAAATGAGASERGEWLASDQDHYAAEADADEDRWQAGADDGADEVEFPIADYDSLTAGQILPLLPQLYADEIPVVEERERATKARPEILDKLAELRAGFTAGSTVEAPPAAARDAEATPTPVDPLASYTEPAASTSAGWDDDADWFPIEDYESLSAAQIRPLLPELDEEELRMVRDKEAALGRRRSLLDEIDRLLGEPAPAASKPAPEPPAPAPAPAAATVPSEAGAPTAPTARAAAKQTTTAKAGTKRAAPKKTPAKKAASKKATAAKAPAKKAATKKAPAKKAAAKKAPAKKAATKKTPAKKAAAPKKASKATTSKKAPAKKSTKRSGGS